MEKKKKKVVVQKAVKTTTKNPCDCDEIFESVFDSSKINHNGFNQSMY